jgi:hypothetical protein
MIDIPGYTLNRQLGRGGMAVVYLATQSGFMPELRRHDRRY